MKVSYADGNQVLSRNRVSERKEKYWKQQHLLFVFLILDASSLWKNSYWNNADKTVTKQYMKRSCETVINSSNHVQLS